MTNQGRTTEPGPSPSIRTRDWVWGVIVVGGGTILVIGAFVWILVGSSSCGTRPAPGYEGADHAGRSCQSVRGRPLVADVASEPAAGGYPAGHVPPIGIRG